MSGLMKWPGSRNKTSNKPDLSKLSDDELDDLMVQAGLMQQDELDRQRDSRLIIALANLPGGPPDYHSTLRGLMRLRDEGPFPFEAQDMYEKLRDRAFADVKAARKATTKVTSSPADIPADMSIGGWLKNKWTSTDEAVRNALQAVASAVGASIPMTRTRYSSVGGKDSSGSQRSDPTLHLTQPEPRSTESPQEKEADHYDGPQWHDDDAPDWESCSSIHEAFRSDTDWY